MAQKLQFGEFALDESSYRLQRGDRLLRLERLPMELLILLVRRRGELVSREEIAGHLWGNSLFVDVDHGINTAIRKIRQALRDDADKPRFLETVVGKGYRFVAAVTLSNGDSNPLARPELRPITQPLSSAVEARDAVVVSPPNTNLSSRRRMMIVRGALILILGASLVTGLALWIHRTEYFWQSPIAGARFQMLTDWGGVARAAAISRDGHFVAFLSDRDGHMDVWVTQVGSGQFHNLTHGSARELMNPSVRTLGFSPDGSLVTFWVRKPDAAGNPAISIWAVPTLGGEARPYLDGAAEYDWSTDGGRLAYHTPGPGDPLFVSNGILQPAGRPIFTAPAGLHSHFPLWSPDAAFIYFVQGSLPDKLDIWRIIPGGGVPERITSRNSYVTHPVLLDRHTLLYLANDSDDSGPNLYSMDVERRIEHRLTWGLDRYRSLAASADGRQLVVTLSSPKTTFWRLRIDDSAATASAPTPISLTTTTGFSPRLGPDYLIYVSAAGASVSIWKLANGSATELWRSQAARILGGPAISIEGRSIAFTARQNGRSLLYVMASDGTNARVVADSLDLQGDPAWAPDGRSITVAASDHGTPHLFRVPLNGGSPVPFISQHSLSPAWAPAGGFLVFSGPDIGTTFSVKAVNPDGSAHASPPLTLTRGARHMTFLPGSHTIVVLRGEIQHKNLWLINLDTGAERQLTNLPSDFDIGDFDLSPDGHELVLQRVQDRSDVATLDLSHR